MSSSSSSHSLHNYLVARLKDHESTCYSVYHVNQKTQACKEVRAILKAAGKDVSELDRRIADVDRALELLKTATSTAIAEFVNGELMVVVPDRKTFKDIEEDSLQ